MLFAATFCVYECRGLNTISLQYTENDRRWLKLQFKIKERQIQTAFEFFQAQKLEPILIKGWAAAIEYPESFLRSSSDIDLCVEPSKYLAAAKLLEEFKMDGLAIDLHNGLRHLDTKDWEELFENCEIKFIEKTPIRILRPEDHLRVLCVHWLTDGGAYKERLWDIYHLLSNKGNKFDWDYCFENISQNRRDWIVKTIAVVRKYLEVDVKSFPFLSENYELPEWFEQTIENEWVSELRLLPLHQSIYNSKSFWKQLRKRFPPNPIQATVDMEGKFDNSTRIFYQIGSVLKRTFPSLKRIIGVFARNKK